MIEIQQDLVYKGFEVLRSLMVASLHLWPPILQLLDAWACSHLLLLDSYMQMTKINFIRVNPQSEFYYQILILGGIWLQILLEITYSICIFIKEKQ